MPVISFKTTLTTIKSWTIVHLPEAASAQLPSRGQVMVKGTINGVPLETALEPDGRWGHWFHITDALQKQIKAEAGDTVTLDIEPTKVWPEPDVPNDLEKALATDADAHDLWTKITPLARWEWIRWIRATSQAETRQRRIEVGISKLKSGERRPCCWNRNLCTEPEVSKNGLLLEPEKSTTER